MTFLLESNFDNCKVASYAKTEKELGAIVAVMECPMHTLSLSFAATVARSSSVSSEAMV
jgi:hypothetical protein